MPSGRRAREGAAPAYLLRPGNQSSRLRTVGVQEDIKMKTPTLALLGLLGASLALCGCATTPSSPVTYDVPLGPAQVTSEYGTPSIAVNGAQDLPAVAGQPLYYEVVSPVNVVFYAFDKDASGGSPPLLSQMEGTSFYGSVVPTGDDVEFLFSSVTRVSGGSVRVTVAGGPMTTGSGPVSFSSPAAPMGGASPQPAVEISPSSATLTAGQSVTLSASGGAGSGDYVWDGVAPATGPSNAYTFNAPGTYTVTVYRAGDGTYAQSNTATATVVVSAPGTAESESGGAPVTVTPVR
jgi:hypothetical protein